jgi:hypothetical protein
VREDRRSEEEKINIIFHLYLSCLVTSATEVDVAMPLTRRRRRQKWISVESEKMKNRDEITGEQNVNRGIAIM